VETADNVQKERYPFIEGAGVRIPDCSRGVYRPFRLTPKEKRALVKRLAESGVKGVDDFLDEVKKEGAVADRLSEIRKRITDEMERIRKDKRRDLRASLRELEREGGTVYGRTEDGLLSDEGEFRRFSSDQLRGEVLASELIRSIEEEPLEDYVEKVSLIRRLLMCLKRLFIRAFLFFRGILMKLASPFRRRKAKGPLDSMGRKKGGVILPFPSLERDLKKWEKRLDDRLDRDRALRETVDRGLSERYGYSQGLVRMKGEVDREWYHHEAKKLLREEVDDRSKRKMEDLERRRKEMLKRGMESTKRALREKDRARVLVQRFEEESARLEEEREKLARETMKKELLRDLSTMGLIRRSGGETDQENLLDWEVTEALVEKFSELIYTELRESSTGPRDLRGNRSSDTGVYEKGRLRTVHEEPRMDLLTSLVNARTKHPKERHMDDLDMVVYREVTTSDLHAVLLMDVSGSMEEKGRMEAAKRSVLALTYAIKRESPRNRVDIIAVTTTPRPVSLREVMGMEPVGFTNIQHSLAMAKEVFDTSRADRHLLFLITDGLPEAYTSAEGEPVAGDLERSLELAMHEAAGLDRYRYLNFRIFLLEAIDDIFIGSARKLAKSGGGRVIVVDPRELGHEVISNFLSEGRVLEGV